MKIYSAFFSERTSHIGLQAHNSTAAIVSCWCTLLHSTGRSNSTGWPQNGTVFWYALTLSNINRFSKLFHSQNQEKMYNNTITTDPTTPQVCRYTTL